MPMLEVVNCRLLVGREDNPLASDHVALAIVFEPWRNRLE
jgi:hypothetical protein